MFCMAQRFVPTELPLDAGASANMIDTLDNGDAEGYNNSIGDPSADELAVRRALSVEEVETNGDGGVYETSDLYTDTDNFIKEVSPADRHAFARSLANKTTGMKQGEVRTCIIYGVNNIYCFDATGYMQGILIDSQNVDSVVEGKEMEGLYEGVHRDGAVADGTADRGESHEGRLHRDMSIYEDGGSTENDDHIFDKKSQSKTQRYSQGNGQNSEGDTRELTRALKTEYGITEEELAAHREAHSSDFVNGDNDAWWSTRHALPENGAEADSDGQTPVQRMAQRARVKQETGRLRGLPVTGIWFKNSTTRITGIRSRNGSPRRNTTR